MVQDWPRDLFPRHQSFSHAYPDSDRQQQAFTTDRFNGDLQRQHAFQQDRYQIDPASTSRFQDSPELNRRQPLMQIDEALRGNCGIAGKNYFVAATGDDGSIMTFFSPGHKLSDHVIRQFFDMNKFQQVMSRLEAGTDPILEDTFAPDEGVPVFNRQIFNRSRPSERRRSSAFGEWENSARSGRKRPRPRNQPPEDDDIPMMVSSRRGIKIGDTAAVWSFYEQRFKNCQQTACKLIAKAWVKAVEPKKQSTHPYTGSDEKAPDWWPKPWGPTKDDKVRHKEPDHLYKREPNGKQHSDIRKLGLNVKKLEEATAEALSSFFLDNEANARKKPYLNEIFKVARQEERFKNGEIDGSTEIYVMAEDKVPESYGSENDDGAFMKEDEESEPPGTKPTTTSTAAVRPVVRTDAATLSNMPGDGFIGELPMRGSQFQPPMMNDMGSQHSFVDGGPMQVHGQNGVGSGGSSLTLDMVPSPSPHDASRRPSVFSDFPSPGGGNLYAQQWQPGTSGQSGSPMYAYGSQQQGMDGAPFVPQGVPMNANQSFMSNSSFDEGTSRQAFDATQSGLFRTDDLSQTAVGQASGYNYLSSDGRGGMMTQVVDNSQRAPMH
ncbi:hypothetical protein K4F52_009161 [Lecanicillium sp. MT-2017a]|nr:hypothetical protein K4F52_009161 [Lecanicillium sp. MT-2017a]